MHATEAIKNSSRRIGQSASFKIVTICALTLILLVPTSMVKSLIYEREGRKESVVEEISGKWGREQTITGPVISAFMLCCSPYPSRAVSAWLTSSQPLRPSD